MTVLRRESLAGAYCSSRGRLRALRRSPREPEMKRSHIGYLVLECGSWWAWSWPSNTTSGRSARATLAPGRLRSWRREAPAAAVEGEETNALTGAAR